MATAETRPRIFDEAEFWYKFQVDYEAAEETLVERREEAEDDADGSEGETEGDDEDGNGEEDQPTLGDVLLEEFRKRKNNQIDEICGDDEQSFEEQVRELSVDDAKQLIAEVYARYIWEVNATGVEYESETETLEEIESLSDDDRMVRESVTEEFDMIWPGDATLSREIEEGEVAGRRFYQASPVIVQSNEEGFEVRGATKHRERVERRFDEEESVTEVDPERADESAVEKVEQLLRADNDSFELIGVDFTESDLPEKSRLRVKNERPIGRDLNALEEAGLVSVSGISEVNTLYLRDISLGGKFRIQVIHHVEGVEFELEASRKSDYHREQFKESFTEITGIEFDTIYEYSGEDGRFLFNRILAENGMAYDRYYEELRADVREVLEGEEDHTGHAPLKQRTEEVKTCEACGESVVADTDECPDCEAETFTDLGEETVLEVNDTSVATYLENRLTDLSPRSERFDISGWEVEERTLAGRKVLRCTFTTLEREGRANQSHHEEVYIVPYGNQMRPGSVNSYLLQTVYLTYGQSASKSNEGYGSLSLYDVITTDDLAGLVGQALESAIVGVRDRTHDQVREAAEKTEAYYERLPEPGAFSDASEELEEIYDPDNPDYFEKHLFYLLKEMFPRTERWGRHGKREADGVLICPKDGTDYYVGSFDAKLSHAADGYDFGSSEEDQATRYLLKEWERKRIEDITGETDAAAHLLVSQNFDESDFPRVAGNVQETLGYARDDVDSSTLVFVEYRALYELYQSYRDWRPHFHHEDVRERFNACVVEALQATETRDGVSFVHFDTASVEGIREGVLGRLEGHGFGQIEEFGDR
jgi:RNA polymerase subunit RPABC4/transcription elongation factor Spt4